jgi:hypothetical protein
MALAIGAFVATVPIMAALAIEACLDLPPTFRDNRLSGENRTKRPPWARTQVVLSKGELDLHGA